MQKNRLEFLLTMTNIKFLFPLLIGFLLLSACSKEKSVSLEGSLANCTDDSLRVYTLVGSDLVQVSAGPLNGGSFSFDAKLPSDGFYWIGVSQRDIRSAVLVAGEKVKLDGQCGALQQAEVQSVSNDLYARLSQQMQLDQQRYDGMYRQMMTTGYVDENMSGQSQQLYGKMKGVIDSLQKADSPIGHALALNISSSPFDPANSLYSSPLEHYVAEYLPLAQLKNPIYAHIPMLGEHAGQFTLLLSQAFPEDQSKFETYLDKFLQRIPGNTVTHRNVTARVIGMLEQARSASYAKYAQPYIAAYPADRNSQRMQQVIPAITQYIRQKAAADALFAEGNTPPDITLPSPKGKEISLSDLKGKIVMIDFWASWCGPCRRENPHVKKLYAQYKSKGFEIFGVSLDNDRGRWLQAIDEDGLEWVHVSDLKKWQSVAAQAYQVSSIPQTFLLDREGRIIGRGLRGASLEQKLREVFEES